MTSLPNNKAKEKFEREVKNLKKTITKFNDLNVDYTEYACLKALTLFKAGEFVFTFYIPSFSIHYCFVF